MTHRRIHLAAAAVALGGLATMTACDGPAFTAASATAQGAGSSQEATAPPSPLASGDTLQLVFEREVFSYPAFSRRNPFSPLTDDSAGPRFEEVELRMVILADSGPGSVATLALRGSGQARGGTGARTFRVREGEVLGNMRIRTIRLREIVVDVDEFGQRETRVLELSRQEPEAQGSDNVLPPPDTTGGDGDTPPPPIPPDTTTTTSGTWNGGSE